MDDFITVLEAVKKYGLEDYDKHYENLFGDKRDIYFPLDKLAKMRDRR